MESIKTRIVAFSILLSAILGQWSCSTGKLLERNSTRYTEHRIDETQTRHLEKELTYNERVVLLNDSSRHLYKVEIFPLDSFVYSIQGGFRGRASRIEVTGSTEHLRHSIDHERGLVASASDSIKSSTSKIKRFERSVSKEVQRKRSGGILIMIILLVCLIIWWCWKYGKVKFS